MCVVGAGDGYAFVGSGSGSDSGGSSHSGSHVFALGTGGGGATNGELRGGLKIRGLPFMRGGGVRTGLCGGEGGSGRAPFIGDLKEGPEDGGSGVLEGL